jgi:hypothetical protein
VIGKLIDFLQENKDNELNEILLKSEKKNSRNFRKRFQVYHEKLINYYCSKVFNEAEFLYEKHFGVNLNHFPRDLFIEQSNLN